MPTLRELRVKQDLSQSRLASLAGVGEQTVWRAEAGKAVRREIARAICQALGTEPDQVEGINFFSAVQAKNRNMQRKQ